MNCAVCRNGQVSTLVSTVTLQKEGTIMIVKEVPVNACQTCGAKYPDEIVQKRVENWAEAALKNHVEVIIRRYVV